MLPNPFRLLHPPFGLLHPRFGMLHPRFGMLHPPFRLLPTPFGLSLSKPLRCAGTGQGLNPLPIPGDQCLFFCPRPTFDLPLESQRSLARLELTLPNQLNRLSGCRVAGVAGLMLRQTRIQLVGVTRVVGAVSAQQQVNVEGFHANGVCVRASTGSARTEVGLKRRWLLAWNVVCEGFDRACPELVEGLTPNGGWLRYGGSTCRHQACPSAFLICSSTSLALAGIGVPGP